MTHPIGDDPGAVSRRGFIASSTALAAGALWVPATRHAPPPRARSSGRPRAFPRDIPLHQERFENWSQAIEVDRVWSCAPRHAHEIVDVVNWAWQHGYRVRP